jgi:hypothetical protein
MTTGARAAADRGGRARALLAPRRRGREMRPPRARPVRADAGRAATFFTVEAGTFESYLPDEATLAASVAGRLDRTTGVVHQAGQR